MHVKTASDSSSVTLDDSTSSAAPPWHHHRQSSTLNNFYYVQSPTEDSSGSTRLHHHEQSLDMSRNMELLPIWNEERDDEWEKIGLDDSALQNVQLYQKVPNDLGYYSEFDKRSECPVFVRVPVALAVVFTVVLVVLWGVSRSFKPRVIVQNIVFTDLDIQQGVDDTGVPTAMISLNSIVKILYKKPFTLCGIQFSTSPLLLHHYGITIASGQMEMLSQPRRREVKTTRVEVQAHRVPLYGGGPYLAMNNHLKPNEAPNNLAKVKIELNLTFDVRGSGNILGSLIKYEFLRSITCSVTVDGAQLGKPINLIRYCIYI